AHPHPRHGRTADRSRRPDAPGGGADLGRPAPRRLRAGREPLFPDSRHGAVRSDRPMTRDPRYDILFEPVRIGPVTAKNRFFQVPHCNGLGFRDPTAMTAMREVKAEGGWAVVCTEQADIHHTSEITPFIELRLWDDRDMPMLARVAERVHAHGALAGIELAYAGMNGSNLYTREIPLAPSHTPIITYYADPVQARAMDKEDIRNLRRWYVNAAL